jgi:hypothetical protein
MTNASKMTVRILRRDTESLQQFKDEEYAYWQSRPPIERLEAMLELSFALFGLKVDEADLRQRFLQSPKILPCPWLLPREQKS